jgi:hypothetical protein
MLDWNKLNPTVNLIEVKKLFYGKYLFKIKFYCPGSRTVYAKDFASILEQIELRKKQQERNYNWGGSWLALHDSVKLENHCKPDQLEFFRLLNLDKKNKNIFLRIEEPDITVYSNDEAALYDLTTKNYPERLLEIHKPKSKNAEEILLKGEIIVSSDFKYNYKIFLKSQIFDNLETKKLLLSKFDLLDELLLVPDGVKRSLIDNKMYFSGGYFYCKNLETASYIKLIFPTMISSIFKLTPACSINKM